MKYLGLHNKLKTVVHPELLQMGTLEEEEGEEEAIIVMSLNFSVHASSQGQQRSLEFCWQLAHQSKMQRWSVQILSIIKI
jgi:hypothetical protein